MNNALRKWAHKIRSLQELPTRNIPCLNQEEQATSRFLIIINTYFWKQYLTFNILSENESSRSWIDFIHQGIFLSKKCFYAACCKNTTKQKQHPLFSIKNQYMEEIVNKTIYWKQITQNYSKKIWKKNLK